MFFMNQTILALAPHTDDVELGCGGTLAKALEMGADVHVAAFATAAESLPDGVAPTQLRDEFLSSMATLDLPESNVSVYDFPVRKLNYHRQEILELLVALRTSVNPTLVLLPASTDLHQDHQVVHAEGLRAFKDVSVWGYELPWNHITFTSQAFVVLEPHHLAAKWRSLEVYQSQINLCRPYFKQDFIEGLARMRGTQIKQQFAESFEVSRLQC